jgi:uncharacterized protein involved in outer membrane biogenesis
VAIERALANHNNHKERQHKRHGGLSRGSAKYNWKSPRGGVNRAKLKFSKIITTTSRVSVRNIIESVRERVENKSQANNEVRHADLFYRGSVPFKPTPRWGGHKGRVSFNPFPLSNDPSDRVSFLFSNAWNTKFPQGSPQDWCLLPQLQVCLITMKIARKHDCKNQATRATNNTRITFSLKSLITNDLFSQFWNLERWRLWMCLGIDC